MEQVNCVRLKNCMKKAVDCGTLTIGFLGGSITQGSLATTAENTYARIVFSWWENTFPEAKFHFVNAGIGGTTSHYGVARAIPDLLVHQPDFVVVDFSVNDEANLFFRETFEGLIRRLLSWESNPAVLILNNAFYNTGQSAQQYHNEIGDWYHVPHISIEDTVYRKIQEGVYAWEALSPDGLHPNDKGHELVAKEITGFLDSVKQRMTEPEAECAMPVPLTENAYECTKRMMSRDILPDLQGFAADTEKKVGLLDHFKEGWIGKVPGDRIVFEIEASCIAIQYRKTIHRPAARARLVFDGDKEHAVILDSNFDEDWGDCLYLEPVLHHGKKEVHCLELEIIDDGIPSATPFYLMSLIVAE